MRRDRNDDFALKGLKVVVPAGSLDAVGWRPGANGEELLAPRAIQAFLWMDAGVDQDEVHFPDVKRLSVEPER